MASGLVGPAQRAIGNTDGRFCGTAVLAKQSIKKTQAFIKRPGFIVSSVVPPQPIRRVCQEADSTYPVRHEIVKDGLPGPGNLKSQQRWALLSASLS